jgi:hypothetical protein
VLQADLWNPLPTADSGRAHLAANEHDPHSPPVGIREDADNSAPSSPDDDHHLRHDPHDADSAALRQALHRDRSRMYRTALHALGASYGAHPLAPDLAAQLRIALTGFAATPVDNDGAAALACRNRSSTPAGADRGALAFKL